MDRIVGGTKGVLNGRVFLPVIIPPAINRARFINIYRQLLRCCLADGYRLIGVN